MVGVRFLNSVKYVESRENVVSRGWVKDMYHPYYDKGNGEEELIVEPFLWTPRLVAPRLVRPARILG